MTTQMNLTAFQQARPSAAFATVPVESLAEGIGSSYGVISYKGKVWSLRYRGEQRNFVRADDGTAAGAIDVVILRQAHNKSKSYYEGYDPNADQKRPICSSLNGIVPDADAVSKQSETCALCPKNEWKQDSSGRRYRDCTDYKRLAVLVMPALTAALFGKPILEPVFLRVPPASLDNLAKMGETMAGQGWHFSSFVTRITFDVDQPHPKLIFTPIQPISDQEAKVILDLRQDPQAERITGEDQSGAGQRPLLTTVSPAPQIAPPATVQQVAPQPAPATAPKQGGFLELTATTVPAQPAVPPAAAATVVSAPTEGDDALNARIANILKQNQ